ncbi:phosphatase [Tersicoccus solisilvae]|uniref:Phosphatase n=1 Tax=Tersicoccus solisilvae TaxID=1882339 RepID=A0ABQ1NXK1_9MICC|nr:PhoX family phosphatase [Tersicoccus solisilvae]GGC86830.1 phosphatase [Tersicoccus solisilvae]
MTETTRTPLSLLPMYGHTRGKRSPVTCHFKCGNACLGETCNTTDNEYFRDVAAAALSRRNVLGLGAAGAVLVAAGSAAAPAAAAPAPAAVPAGHGYGPGQGAGSRLPFATITPVDKTVDAFTVPAGYTWSPIIRWGDPLFADAPAFDLQRQTPAAQKRQFGYNNDYTDIIVDQGSGRTGILVCNQEYVNPGIMFPATTDPAQQARNRAIARAAHGMSVVELRRRRKGQPWTYTVGGRRNRRIDADTTFAFDGPAAGSALLRTVEHRDGRTTRGTIGNCSGGTTPWGTVLSGEENFNGYFRTPGTSTEDKRYGLADKPSTYGWEADEKRWDTRNPGYENASNHFGWIVEIDPQNPGSRPVKHTAMGRFKHEGANVRVDDRGRVVAYMGDDERFDYLYKFVSRRTISRNRAENLGLLSDGDLFVAKFRGDSPAPQIDGSGTLPADGQFDGTGMWLPLVLHGRSMVDGMSVDEVLVHTRLAADKVGATKMDRCEDVQPNPLTGRVYVACTNNTDRGKAGKAGPDEANPRNANKDGHIVEISESRNRADATTFTWNLLLVCGDPADPTTQTYFAGFPKDKVSPISCPDNVAFDSGGNLWISTDGAPSTIGYNDGLFKVALGGRERGRVQQFLSVPTEAETCGPVIHDREGMVYVAVQHPGEEGSFADQHSFFPDYVRPGTTPRRGQVAAPRPSVVQVYRR